MFAILTLLLACGIQGDADPCMPVYLPCGDHVVDYCCPTGAVDGTE